MAEFPALSCREDGLVQNGAAAPKSCVPSLEIRSPTAAGGLLPTGEASIATVTTYNQPPLRLYSTEETDSKKTNLRTPILYVPYDSSFLPAAPSCRRVIETKSGENRMFDRRGSRSSPRLLVYGNVACVALWRRYACWSGWWRFAAFSRRSMIRDSKTFRSGAGKIFTPFV